MLGINWILQVLHLLTTSGWLRLVVEFEVTGNTLECHQSMTTNTTQESIMLPHLHSILTKVE